MKVLAGSDDPSVILARELEQWGCTHAEIGAYLMSIWGLPVPLTHAVAFHHFPSKASVSTFSPLAAVHFADAIDSEGTGCAINRDVQFDRSYLEGLGLQEQEPTWRSLHQAMNAKPEERCL